MPFEAHFRRLVSQACRSWDPGSSARLARSADEDSCPWGDPEAKLDAVLALTLAGEVPAVLFQERRITTRTFIAAESRTPVVLPPACFAIKPVSPSRSQWALREEPNLAVAAACHESCSVRGPLRQHRASMGQRNDA